MHFSKLLGNGRFRSVRILLSAAMVLLIGESAGATSTTYSLDANFSFPSTQNISNQGSFTADSVTGTISAFSWQAIASYGFTELDQDDTFSGFAAFDTDGALTGLTISVSDGFTTLILGLNNGASGPLAELTTATGVFASGTYGVRLADSNTHMIGTGASPVPEPTGGLLYGAGLLVAGATLRQRRRG